MLAPGAGEILLPYFRGRRKPATASGDSGPVGSQRWPGRNGPESAVGRKILLDKRSGLAKLGSDSQDFFRNYLPRKLKSVVSERFPEESILAGSPEEDHFPHPANSR